MAPPVIKDMGHMHYTVRVDLRFMGKPEDQIMILASVVFRPEFPGFLHKLPLKCR